MPEIILYKNEVDRLRIGLIAAANRIEKVAFDIPPPNVHTPQLVALAISMRSYASQGLTK